MRELCAIVQPERIALLTRQLERAKEALQSIGYHEDDCGNRLGHAVAAQECLAEIEGMELERD